MEFDFNLSIGIVSTDPSETSTILWVGQMYDMENANDSYSINGWSHLLTLEKEIGILTITISKHH